MPRRRANNKLHIFRTLEHDTHDKITNYINDNQVNRLNRSSQLLCSDDNSKLDSEIRATAKLKNQRVRLFTTQIESTAKIIGLVIYVFYFQNLNEWSKDRTTTSILSDEEIVKVLNSMNRRWNEELLRQGIENSTMTCSQRLLSLALIVHLLLKTQKANNN